MERAVPLGDSQRIMLLNIIKEHEKIITDKTTGSLILARKREAWEDITKKFNSIYTDQHPRSSRQIKRCFDHVKRKVKQEDATMKKLRPTGGGLAPDLQKPSEEFVIAASLMSEELNMNKDVLETYHPVDETGEPILDVNLSITEPLPSTSAQLESGSATIETSLTFINSSATSSPSSMEHLVFKSIFLPNTSPSSTPAATPDRPSRKSHSISQDVYPKPRFSIPIHKSHSSTQKFKVEDAYVKCMERQEQLHNLRMENEKKRHIMAKKEHELKVELINNKINFVDDMHSSAKTVLNNFNSFLNRGNSAYKALRNSYE